MPKKTYIMPVVTRRGNPIIHFIEKDDNSYWLGTYHHLQEIPKGKVYKGIGQEYDAVHRLRINKSVYKSLMEESKQNHCKFKINS
jgi:hypothetical protein